MNDPFSAPKQLRPRLLGIRLWVNKTDLGSLCGYDDRFRVGSIVLLAFYEWTYILRCDQFYLMAVFSYLAGPIMGAATGLDDNDHGRM